MSKSRPEEGQVQTQYQVQDHIFMVFDLVMDSGACGLGLDFYPLLVLALVLIQTRMSWSRLQHWSEQ